MAEPTLYDAYNRPIKKDELVREFAAPTLAGIRTLWTNTVAGGITPQRLAALLQNAVDGDTHDYLTLAEEMEEREPHYASVLGTRKRAVTGLPVMVEAAGDDAAGQKHADAVREMIKRGGFKGMTEDLLDAVGKSYSAVEIMWDRSGSRWYPERYEHRDPRFFVFDRVARRELRLLDEADMLDGLPLPPYKFIVHIPRLKSGIPIRGGLARLVAWSYMAKMYTFKDWLAFVEIFGMPLRIGKYGPNAIDSDINILKTAVANLGSDAAAVLPDSMKIEFEKQAQTTGADNLFVGLAEWIDKQISKAVLGQTMTADDGSSQSQATVHDKVRGDIRDSDAGQLEETLNLQLVKPFIDLNFGPQKSYPTVKLYIKTPEDIAALTTALKELVPLGLRVEQSVVRDKLNIPDPPQDATPEDILGAPKPAAVPALNRHDQNCPHCSTALNQATPPTDEIDGFANRLATEADPAMSAMIDKVREMVMAGESLAGIRDQMFTLYDQIDSDRMGQVMTNALTAANLAGRAEVSNGD
jgi:phage gp29-like protein